MGTMVSTHSTLCVCVCVCVCVRACACVCVCVFVSSCQATKVLISKYLATSGGVSRWDEWVRKATAYKFDTCTLIGVHEMHGRVDPIKVHVSYT